MKNFLLIRRRSTMEKWKDIDGFEGLYQVSDLGRVRSSYRNSSKGLGYDKILKTRIKHNGYLSVDLCKDGIKKHYLVHRLVAIAFIDNPLNLPIVNHKDEHKDHCEADNLEWCTQQYNVNYGEGSKARNSKVRQFDFEGRLIKIWDSIKEAEALLGIKYQNISRCCRKDRRSAGGYIWRYDRESAA
jgi:hypothetical protein